MFIAALGELVSVAAVSLAVVPIALVVLDPAAMPASGAAGALEALSADELGAEALSLMVSPCCMLVSPGMGLVASPVLDCALVVVEELGGVAAAPFIADCALTAPGIMMAAAARRSTLRMV